MYGFGDIEQLVESALNAEPTTEAEIAEAQIAFRLNSMIHELDEFVGMAANPETVDLIEREAIAFGQVLSRAQMIASFLQAHRPKPQFRLVK